MSRGKWLVLCVCGVLMATIAVAAQPDPHDKNKVGAFMQLKLDHAKDVLDGLAQGDFSKIDKSAQKISLLTQDEIWQVMQSPEYRRRSEEFRRTADKIAKAAQEKNLDAATLGYVEMTLQCVSCHRSVRGK